MKTAILLILGFISIACLDYSSSNYLFEKIKTSDIKTIEKRFKSKEIKSDVLTSLSSDYYPYVESYQIEQPIQYLRKDKEMYDYKVNYFFDMKTHSVKLIDYTWDKNSFIDNIFDLQKELKEEYKNFDAYDAKFNQVFHEVKEILGKPTEGNGLLKKENTEQGELWIRNAKWINEDRAVELNMIFTPKGWTGFLGTYRIRLKTYWK